MKNAKIALGLTILMCLSHMVNAQITLLSGPEKGSYNQFADDISKMLSSCCNITVTNKSTGGSAYNFTAITDPQSSMKLALIQSDYLNLMEVEDRMNNTTKTKTLNIVMPLATEEIQFLVKKGSGLNKLQDLEMKKVGIGNSDLGSNATGKIIKERTKIFWYPYEIGFDEILQGLSNGRIDAGLVVGSAPVDLLNLNPQAMPDELSLLTLENFNGWARYYDADTIYAGTYKWLDANVPTFAVRTLLVVNTAKLSTKEAEMVEAIKAGIVANLDQLAKNGHPQWKTVLIPDGPVASAIGSTPAQPAAVQATEPTKPAQPATEKICYKVQLYSRNYEQKADPIVVQDKSYTPGVYYYLGAYRYTIGEFNSLQEAVSLQNFCRELGYNQAFVAGFKNNIRCTDPEIFK